MSAPEFVHVADIRTTPEQLWRALTEPAFMERYWGIVLRSDWQVGSPISWEKRGVRQSDPRFVVLEADRPRRLAYVWHTITREWNDPAALGEERFRRAAAEPLSRVSFTLEPRGDLVRLTVVHGGFAPGSVVAEMVTRGWPLVVASLKSLLETGHSRPATS